MPVPDNTVSVLRRRWTVITSLFVCVLLFAIDFVSRPKWFGHYVYYDTVTGTIRYDSYRFLRLAHRREWASEFRPMSEKRIWRSAGKSSILRQNRFGGQQSAICHSIRRLDNALKHSSEDSQHKKELFSEGLRLAEANANEQLWLLIDRVLDGG
jgi:hypothetical protein